MKKILAILFLAVYLFTSTEFTQLLKIPALIEHFSEHKAEKKDISLGSFLFNHYSSDNDGDDDMSGDMKLPFKSHDNFTSTNLQVFIPSDPLIYSTPKVITFITKKNSIYNESGFAFSYLSNVWQPPKFC